MNHRTYILSLVIAVIFLTTAFISNKKFNTVYKTKTELLVFNAKIYTLSPNNNVADAMVIYKGKIVFVGKEDSARAHYEAVKEINLNGKFVYPGFIDAHCHFYGYGQSLGRINLVGTKSWNDVISITEQYAVSHPGGWVQGRGWDQNDWEVKQFPTNESLNGICSGRPIFLKRIDGHAAIANDAALKLAGFTVATKISGGQLIIKNGKLTGVLIDNAMDSLEKIIPKPSPAEIAASLLSAQDKCFAVGLTTVSDAGLEKEVIDVIDSLQKTGELKMRIYAMLTDNDANRNYYYKNGPYKTDRLDVRAFKFYADGALGSRGALLKKPYTDEQGSYGLLLKPTEYFERKFAECAANGFQVCTHCIGDSANKLVLDLYGKILGGLNMKRWRIEHAQVVSPEDMKLFSKYSVIPSIQPCFATSDMPWAQQRLGDKRMKGAYAWKSLLVAANIVACGSDFPVEEINPLYGFYAAITRMNRNGEPPFGFMPSEILTRQQALYGMTTWAAYSNFEENEKGSLVAGKFADFTVLEDDIMTMPDIHTWMSKILMTVVNGEVVYQSNN